MPFKHRLLQQKVFPNQTWEGPELECFWGLFPKAEHCLAWSLLPAPRLRWLLAFEQQFRDRGACLSLPCLFAG